MDNASKNSRRDALRRLDSLMPVNPLEVLMVGEDLVRAIEAEDLKPIVRAIGNTIIRELHPDTATTKKLIGRLSIEQVLLAINDYNENPEKIRQEYLGTFSKTRKNQFGREQIDTKIIRINPVDSATEIFESLYSEESVIKIKNATVLLNSVSQNSTQRHQNPLQSLRVKNNQASIRPVKYYSNDFTDQERKQIIQSIVKLPTNEDSTAFFVSSEGLTVITDRSQEVIVSPNNFPELLQEGWWYKIIGTTRNDDETRSIISYKPLSTQQSVKLLGSIPLNIANIVSHDIIQRSQAANQNRPALKNGNKRINPTAKWKNLTMIPEDVWQDLLQSTASNDQLIFKPYLMPNHVLIGENKDKNKIIIGETSFISAEYY